MNIEMSETAALFTRAVIQQRLDEIAAFNRNYPELPRQDDVEATYREALAAVTAALPAWAQTI